MRIKKILKKGLKITFFIIALFFFIIIGLLIKQNIINRHINNDISTIFTNPKYEKAVSIEGMEIVNQKISCGYACIEMLSKWNGQKVTEQALFEQNNGKITTAMGNGFLKEMQKQFPNRQITKNKNLTNTDLIDKMYKSITKGNPVPIEFASWYSNGTNGKWTLHFGIVSGMDVMNDRITVINPYGYIENYSIEDFLKATRFDSYENMELFLKSGFLVGVFNKNTIYLLEK